MPIVDQAIDPLAPSSTRVKLTITLPEPVYLRYEESARAERVPTEKCISDRLRRCIDHTATRPLYFNDAQRNDLERITGGHVIHSPDQALAYIRTTCDIKIGDVQITLAPRLLQRAAARAKCRRMPIEKWLEREIVEGLERSVGIRPY